MRSPPLSLLRSTARVACRPSRLFDGLDRSTRRVAIDDRCAGGVPRACRAVSRDSDEKKEEAERLDGQLQQAWLALEQKQLTAAQCDWQGLNPSCGSVAAACTTAAGELQQAQAAANDLKQRAADAKAAALTQLLAAARCGWEARCPNVRLNTTQPTPTPTAAPSSAPTDAPTDRPTATPTLAPSEVPTITRTEVRRVHHRFTRPRWVLCFTLQRRFAFVAGSYCCADAEPNRRAVVCSCA